MTSPTPHIAILGGGLTGLSAAYHLTRLHPNARITVLEKSAQFGGWLRSERVEVADADDRKASVLLEAGPRTFRANAKSVLELVNLLHLQPRVVTAARTSPAARNRFLHIPPTPGLQALPSSLLSLFTSPLSPLLLSALISEPLSAANRPAGASDESVHAFFARRFGQEFARVLGSALVHGIYGADSRKLSVRAAFPSMWTAEDVGRGSVIWGELGPRAWMGAAAAARAEVKKNEEEAEGWELGFAEDTEWERMMKCAAVFSFRDGMGELVGALVRALEKSGRVELRTGIEVRRLERPQSVSDFELHLADGDILHPTHVISALPLPALGAILPTPTSLPHLTANPSSTVIVLNLVFATAGLSEPLHPPGFGYLIPRPEEGYDVSADSKSTGILGVVFDTASLAAQDHALDASSSSDVNFVKMTAMLGGPYPLPAGEPALNDVLERLSVHLGTALPRPVYYRFHRNVDSIPTYLPGHLERVAEMRAVLRAEWGGRLKVVGAGIGGVSMADCIKAGRDVAREIVREGEFVL